MGPPAGPGVQVTPDFSRIDFDRLWAGRGKVTEVEGALLDGLIRSEPPGPMLEIGCGAGRLSPYLARWAAPLISCDATLPVLRAAWGRLRPDSSAVGANVYRLPFRNGTFAAASLVRVFGFLSDPAGALGEIRRVLQPRGVVLLSVEPHPSLGSLVDDLKVGLSGNAERRWRPRTFSTAPEAAVHPSAYPAWSRTRRRLRELADQSGFELEEELPCGLEDLAPFRWLPVSVFVGVARSMSGAGGFPTRFLRLRARGRR